LEEKETARTTSGKCSTVNINNNNNKTGAGQNPGDPGFFEGGVPTDRTIKIPRAPASHVCREICCRAGRVTRVFFGDPVAAEDSINTRSTISRLVIAARRPAPGKIPTSEPAAARIRGRRNEMVAARRTATTRKASQISGRNPASSRLQTAAVRAPRDNNPREPQPKDRPISARARRNHSGLVRSRNLNRRQKPTAAAGDVSDTPA